MVHRPTSAAKDATGLTNELLGRMGLTSAASQEDIESAHDRILEFLQQAPRGLRSWAEREITAADEAFVLLSDPAADLHAADPDAADAAGPAAEPPSTATRTSRRTHPARTGLVGAVIAAVVLGGYAIGREPGVPGISGTPTDQSSTAPPATPVDQAKVAALMAKVSANPKDVDSLRTLGDTYFQAADYATASSWQQKILALDPKDATAHLALGAAQFNLGNAAEAERHWRQVVALNPRQAEAHYDLGFLYLSQSPPDLAKVREEWRTVVEIDPASAIAKTVATHLASLDGATPSPSPTDGH
ncbi:MAG: tetratricopeptide repeat protein [Actinobacteria bacterium]|nr:tetratricopeptide repeat protein [Actinomycetota bacterium]MBI3686873.1 tetratricopeptide repeat protein [Actinomycetota bacterium]